MLNSAVSVVRTPSSLTSFLLVKMKWINWVGVRLSQFFILFITSCKTNCCPVHVVRVFDQLFWITQHHCPFIKCNSGHSSTVYFMCIFPLYENSCFSMHSCLLWPSPDLALLQKTFFYSLYLLTCKSLLLCYVVLILFSNVFSPLVLCSEITVHFTAGW